MEQFLQSLLQFSYLLSYFFKTFEITNLINLKKRSSMRIGIETIVTQKIINILKVSLKIFLILKENKVFSIS